MSSVVETRTLSFKNIIVSPEGIRAVADILTDAINRQKTPESLIKTSYGINAEGQISFNSTSSDIFNNKGPLESHRISQIGMSAWDFESDSRIEVSFTHGDSGYGNTAKITSPDSMWVSGVTHKLQEAVGKFKKQPDWPRKFIPLLGVLAAVSIGVTVTLIFSLIQKYAFHVQATASRPHLVELLLTTSGFLISIVVIGAVPAWYLTSKLADLWPTVELQMGQEWVQIEKKRRNMLWSFITIIIVPIILSFIHS
jgi:hypothetical protein